MLIHRIPKEWLKSIRLMSAAVEGKIPAAFLAAVVCHETGITVNGYPNRISGAPWNNLTAIGGVEATRSFASVGLSLAALVSRVACHDSRYEASQAIFDEEGCSERFIEAFAAMYAAPSEAKDWAACVKKYMFVFGPEFAEIGEIA